MIRKESWRQDTPQMQIGALLASVQGDLANIADGIKSPDPEARFERMRQCLNEAQEIARNLPDTDWAVVNNRQKK